MTFRFSQICQWERSSSSKGSRTATCSISLAFSHPFFASSFLYQMDHYCKFHNSFHPSYLTILHFRHLNQKMMPNLRRRSLVCSIIFFVQHLYHQVVYRKGHQLIILTTWCRYSQRSILILRHWSQYHFFTALLLTDSMSQFSLPQPERCR